MPNRLSPKFLLGLLGALSIGALVRWRLLRGGDVPPNPNPSPNNDGLNRFVEPYRWPADKERITLAFGAVWEDVYTPINPHKGLDVSPWPGATGAAAYAPMSGEVATAVHGHPTLGNYVLLSRQSASSFFASDLKGNLRKIPRGGRYEMLLAHLDTIRIKTGAKINAGDSIGTIGATGLAFGAHIHWELRYNGIRLDPMGFALAADPALAKRVIYAG